MGKRKAGEFKALCLQVWTAAQDENGNVGCWLCGRTLHIARAHNFSHKRHRGMGGNPAGDRNVGGNIQVVCYECHAITDGQRVRGAEWMD